METFVEPPKVYAAWRKEAYKQAGSSSGGVAAALYENAIANGYYVVGTYSDENFMPKMKVTKDVKDIELFKGSKYVQADTGSVYEEIRQLIVEGNKVLFIGTPCQCSAARNVVKNTANLITVELICHGVPSQKVFCDYLEWVQKETKKKITEMACATSSSSASITGAVAATAEPPQIEEPTPTSVEILEGMCSRRHRSQDTSREVDMVAMIMGRDCAPVESTAPRFMPKPSRMTAHWRIFLDVKAMPLLYGVLSLMNRVMIMPAKMAITGPPMMGNCFPRSQDGTAIIAHSSKPRPFS